MYVQPWTRENRVSCPVECQWPPSSGSSLLCGSRLPIGADSSRSRLPIVDEALLSVAEAYQPRSQERPAAQQARKSEGRAVRVEMVFDL